MSLRYTRITTWQESEEQLRAIRHEVFIVGQHCPPEIEWDQLNATATHFLVKDTDDTVFACARLIRDDYAAFKASVGRVAVYPKYRRQGIARRLMTYIMAFARSQGIIILELNSQTYVADGLYAKLGFVKCSEIYDECGIPHVKMRLVLEKVEKKNQHKLGLDRHIYRYDDQKDYSSHLIALISQAKHRVNILSQDMEKGSLDQSKVLDAVSALARKSRSASVKILIEDPRTPVATSNQLLKLSQRLTSSIEVKVLDPDIEFPEEVFVLVDKEGVVLRHSYRSWDGFCCYADSGTVKRLSDEFNRLMSYAHSSAELTRISL